MDSYTTVIYADEYHDKRVSSTKWDMFDDEQKGHRLVSATDFINYNFTLKKEVVKEIEDGNVPLALQNATCEIAVMDSLIVARARDMSEVKVDVIAVKYADGADAYTNDLSKIESMLKGLVEEEFNTGLQFEVAR